MGGSIRQTLPLAAHSDSPRLATLVVTGRSGGRRLDCDCSLFDGEPLVARLLTRVTSGFLLGAIAGLFWGLWAVPRAARSIVGTE
jgi:hypothetical protein